MTTAIATAIATDATSKLISNTTKMGSVSLSNDPYLVDSIDTIIKRYSYFQCILNDINSSEPGGITSFSKAYMGERGMSLMIKDDKSFFSYKEWAPSAQRAFLIGDFSIFTLYFN